MKKEIIISYKTNNTRVALLEEGQLVEFYTEGETNTRSVGNIYKGIVQDILPGMQAAFVNIGFSKNAFLYVGDLVTNGGEEQPIEKLLKKGQEIMVQISKEGIGSKGPRVTCQLTIPGRYLVLMPFNNYIGISRRIEDEGERERLKEVAEEIKDPNMGLIVRTVAQYIDKGELENDLNYLFGIWNNTLENYQNYSSPALIYNDVDLVERALRDLFDNQVDGLYIDDQEQYRKIINILKRKAKHSHLLNKVRLYQSKSPIFHAFGIEKDLEKAFQRKIWLKNGSYLVIDQLEALTVIDVNTGKFVGTNNLADTVLQTNLEAVKEICRQIRLRDVSGIIIIDFIDMFREEDKELVLKYLEAEMKKDQTKGQILGITKLGLVEITRKKVRKGIYNSLQQVCPTCHGIGKTMTKSALKMFLEDKIRNYVYTNQNKEYEVKVHPVMVDELTKTLDIFQQELGVKLLIKPVENVEANYLEIESP
ncbi:ribonuclease G [Anaerobranca californiensis DSM 14826]|uniref:Ribonuclease G n=1 Tax=Anaerobranca californiensis DSM 14826 TaxID=1120989 RepID=A0A1M6NI89_9FIRM|nr:Rne/Rng family ribonuclease [Anaerobranca californiensis]SHJ95334.1 ribonuclease G [Anaerobranca californiensis DSM 14826]